MVLKIEAFCLLLYPNVINLVFFSNSFPQTHVYEDIQDVNNEELQQQRQSDGEAATITTVYDLVQAVN